MKLKDKVAVVTGAGAGIGSAIAREFVKEGASVAICDVKQDKLAAAESELQGLGGSVLSMRADVGLQKDVQVLFEGVLKQFGGLPERLLASVRDIVPPLSPGGGASVHRAAMRGIRGACRSGRSTLPYAPLWHAVLR